MDLLCISHQAQADVEIGKYDSNPARLLALSKGMYLYESLKDIAQDKTSELEAAEQQKEAAKRQKIDETEVNYGYFLNFNTPISKFLGVELKAMRYARDSQITPEDVKAAVNTLKSQSQDGWVAFLATWPPMNSLLVRLGHEDVINRVSTRIEQEQARIEEKMDELFDSREKLTNQGYQDENNKLTAEYNNVEKKISIEEKHGIITALLKRHRIDAKLL